MLDHDPSLHWEAATRGDPQRTLAPDDVLPEGVVTFLLTDIEGSTELWDRRADDMSGALTRHEHIIEEIVLSSRTTPQIAW